MGRRCELPNNMERALLRNSRVPAVKENAEEAALSEPSSLNCSDSPVNTCISLRFLTSSSASFDRKRGWLGRQRLISGYDVPFLGLSC